MQEKIQQALQEVAAEEQVRILYACESGSRAWGFPSKDSDYDVRFIYAHPRDWYLSIDVERRRDVIERPVEEKLDLGGWDLRKALGLLKKSNPPLMEWLQSPIIYHEDPEPVEGMRELMKRNFSPRSCFHHYLSMTHGQMLRMEKDGRAKHKVYFYILRPLMACRWIVEGWGPVPTEFQKLLERCIHEPRLLGEIQDLYGRKLESNEMDWGPIILPIHEYIVREYHELKELAESVPHVRADMDALNDYFRAVVA